MQYIEAESSRELGNLTRCYQIAMSAMSVVFVCWHMYHKYKSVELGDQLTSTTDAVTWMHLLLIQLSVPAPVWKLLLTELIKRALGR